MHREFSTPLPPPRTASLLFAPPLQTQRLGLRLFLSWVDFQPFIFNHFHDAPPATIFLSCSCTFAGVCTPLSSSSRVPYTLPSSVYPKSFVCHSYENCRGVGVFLPLWTFTKLLSFVEPPFHRTRFSVLLCLLSLLYLLNFLYFICSPLAHGIRYPRSERFRVSIPA